MAGVLIIAPKQACVMLTFDLKNGVILLLGDLAWKESGIDDFPEFGYRRSFPLWFASSSDH